MERYIFFSEQGTVYVFHMSFCFSFNSVLFCFIIPDIEIFVKFSGENGLKSLLPVIHLSFAITLDNCKVGYQGQGLNETRGRKFVTKLK